MKLYPYIDKEDVLKYIDQLEVWCWLLDFKIEIGEYFSNPFRVDNNPGCTLSFGNKYLLLKDYADPQYHNWNIFHATMFKYNLNFDKACALIWETFTGSKPLVLQERDTHDNSNNCFIDFIPNIKNNKPIFLQRDADYWKPYGIHSNQLTDDFVYSVNVYRFNDKFNRIFQIYPNEPCYAYAGFDSGNVKIYTPYKEEGKWITNCNADDIWFIDEALSSNIDTLFICKSYKDGRIQKNLGFNTIAVQNEGIILSMKVINTLASKFKDIIIYFDNDKAGIDNSIRLADYCNSKSLTNKFRYFWLPEKSVKDNGEYFLKYGANSLKKQINNIL